jgi:Protein of unknown function (DUF2559)
MLSTEQKQQIFIKLRVDNYQASLRLEGFRPLPANAAIRPTLEQLIAKHGR